MKHKLTVKKYLVSLATNKLRLSLLILCLLFFITIPPRLIYSFPLLEPKAPLFREINLTIPSPDPYPVKVTQVPPPEFSATSAIAIDVRSKAVIYMKNPDKQLFPASTTKMVTALVASKVYPLDKVASVSSPIREGQVMELVEGEQISIKNLLYGLLVYSGNDAAEELARMYPGGREAFVERMNLEVNSLGLKNTHFVNPTGLDNPNHYATVHDLAIIGAEVMSHPALTEMVATKSIVVTDTSGQISHKLENINQLLDVVPGLKGIKTGWTEVAGECLVAYTQRDGHAVITAILGSYDRFGETRSLVEWVFNNHQWQQIELSQ